MLQVFMTSFRQNTSYPTNMDVLADLPCLPTVDHLDSPPSFSEVCKAIAGLKNNKSPGLDGIQAEVLKHGGYLLTRRLHQLISAIWSHMKSSHKIGRMPKSSQSSSTKVTKQTVVTAEVSPSYQWLGRC